MSLWSGAIMTNKGRELQAKVEANMCKLNFSKMKAGTGSLPAGTTPESLLDLVEPKQVLGIKTLDVSENHDMAVVSTAISNVELEQGYYVREIGLYAMDPDAGEILFAYASDSAPEYLPSNEASASTIVIDFNMYIGITNSTEVTAVIDLTGYASVANVQTLIHQLHVRLLGMKYDEPTETLTLPRAIGSVTNEELTLSWEEYTNE